MGNNAHQWFVITRVYCNININRFCFLQNQFGCTIEDDLHYNGPAVVVVYDVSTSWSSGGGIPAPSPKDWPMIRLFKMFTCIHWDVIN